MVEADTKSDQDIFSSPSTVAFTKLHSHIPKPLLFRTHRCLQPKRDKPPVKQAVLQRADSFLFLASRQRFKDVHK